MLLPLLAHPVVGICIIASGVSIASRSLRVEHVVQFGFSELEVVGQQDASGKRTARREETVSHRCGPFDPDQPCHGYAVARDLDGFSGLNPREQLRQVRLGPADIDQLDVNLAWLTQLSQGCMAVG